MRRHVSVIVGALVTLATTACGTTTDDEVDDAPISFVDDVTDRLDQAADALDDGDFSTMFQALSLTSIGDEIEGRAVTVLAPTDDAFAAFDADALADLLSDPTEIDDVLRRHVLDEAVPFDELVGRTEVTTIDGDVLPVEVDGSTVRVGGATVSPVAVSDQATSDSELVVLALDTVLSGDD